ncbi:MAG: hypothetical protein ABJA98_27470 [Acidobacteriota bacterium]
MSTTIAFTPWARVGIGAAITAPLGALRAQFPIEVQVGGTIAAAAAPIVDAPPLVAQTLGPGDVLGIDARVVTRTDPGPYAQGVPAHSLVSIEFSRADFPWLFSPLAPDAQQRLQPWITLVVVPRRPGITLRSRDTGLQVLAVDSPSELPDLAEAWAWAHAQTIGAPPAAAGPSGDGTGLSRLVSPRRLERATAYYACLVPTFNVGRQVGLDSTVEPAGPLGPAWTGSIAVPFELPVYFAWSFATGEAGDFHDLVAKLRAQPLPSDAGWRPVTIAFPSSPAPAGFQAFTAPLEGVLRNLTDPPPASDSTAAASVAQELRRVTGLLRAVAPPRYAQAQAVAGAPWLDDLNASPVARIAAATGARVVQARQEALMAEAWTQAGDLQRANQQRHQADAALAVGNALMRRHLRVMSTNHLLQLVAPTGLPTTGGLAAAAFIAGVPATTLNGTFRRLQRRTGSLARRSAPAASGSGISMLGLPSATGLSAMGLIDRVRFGMTRPELFPTRATVVPFPEGDAMPPGRTSAHASYTWRGLLPAHLPTRPRPSTITRFTSVFGAAVPWTLDDTTQFDADADPIALFVRRQTAINFAAAALAVQHYLHDTMMPRAGAMPFIHHVTPGDPDAARAQLLDALSPARALNARVAGAVSGNRSAPRAFSPRADAVLSDPLPGPAGFGALRYDPMFPHGMYSALADVAPDLFLVGADRMTDNTVSLVRTNARFIEAYLAGLNHEMGRELLWRGFPSDGRGTCFRRFWDSDNYPSLSAWRGALGTNVSAPDWLVLLVRGEIVRRFPQADVFAQRGALDASSTQFVPSAEPRRLPLFRVTLRDDLLCVGFDLTRAQAFDYFFGIEEQITAPRFAAPATPGGSYVKLSELPLRAGAHAGDVAAATLRRPVRVLIDPHVLVP